MDQKADPRQALGKTPTTKGEKGSEENHERRPLGPTPRRQVHGRIVGKDLVAQS